MAATDDLLALFACSAPEDDSEPMSETELIARLAVLAETDRPRYERIRDAMWRVVQERYESGELVMDPTEAN